MKKKIMNRKLCKQKLYMVLCVLYLNVNKVVVNADTKSSGGSLESSQAATGLKLLLGDLGALILGLTLPVACVCAGYFFLRLNASDEGDQKQWKKRLWLTFFCAIGSFAIGGILTNVTGYFKK